MAKDLNAGAPASSEPRPEVRDCPLMHGAAPCPMCAYCPHGLTAGRGADERCLECGASVTAASPDERLREAVAALPQYVITIQDREGYTYERGCAGQPMNYTGVMLADVEAAVDALAAALPDPPRDCTCGEFCSGCGGRRAVAPDEGWSPGIDDPEPPALGDIDTGEGWYQT